MIDKKFKAQEFREIKINRGLPIEHHIYPNNYISTGKYTLLSLIPKNIFEQFHRIANIWFLIVSIFQLLPLNLSPTSSWATIAPLSLVIFVTLLKDAYNDYQRHQSDKEINFRSTKIWKDTENKFDTEMWMNIEVGNLLYLQNGEPVPADFIILLTENADGICYIETSSLDGENNLKSKEALHETVPWFEQENHNWAQLIKRFDNGILKSEHPNNRLYKYEGSLTLSEFPKAISIDQNNVILRGSTIKNTKWVFGIVVFTGGDTKLMINSHSAIQKRSNVEKRVNKYLIIVFTMLFAFSALSTIISVLYAYSEASTVEYFGGSTKDSSILGIITFLILYNSLVPISLYVSMDIVRVIQAKHIQWDLRMYYEPLDRPAIAKSGDLNETLGQIEYIFSDKTGTLTENQMEFKRCAIKGRLYGYREESKGGSENVCINSHPKFKFYDPILLADLRGYYHDEIHDFLECIALCHTVVSEELEDGSINYQASSPDEEALVIAAHAMGYSFISNKLGVCSFSADGVVEEFRVIGTNEFNSFRKRMSIALEPISDTNKPPILYCKGADDVMLAKLKLSDDEKEDVKRHLLEFALEGLRTLVLARKILSKEQAEDFEKKWNSARNAMSDRTKRLDEVAEEFEVDMEYIGVTAIEDKIQSGVPETIATLMEADIKVWVLTGDKQETAINIGYSCKLLRKDMTVITINATSMENARDLLRKALSKNVIIQRKFEPPKTFVRVNNIRPNSMGSSSSLSVSHMIDDGFEFPIEIKNINLGLVIDGASLQFILSDLKCLKYFSTLSFLCHAVICCRVSPLQKSEVVKLVKNHFDFKPITMSIGDGANDVPMIQEAHVGIGISGVEGLQAVNSSDYAIARFRYLIPLLFLHGRWNYRRITRVILYSFYKNFLLVIPQFYFSFINLYSGTAWYDSWLILSYNVALTSIPIMVLGVLDKDYDSNLVLKYPQLYKDGIYSKMFNAKIFINWAVLAICQTLIIYIFLTCGITGSVSDKGYTEDIMITGTIAFYSVVQTATCTIFLEMKSWNLLFVIITIISLFIFFPFIFVYDFSKFPTTQMIGISTEIFMTPIFIICLILVGLTCFIVVFAAKYIKSLWFPSGYETVVNAQINLVHPERSYATQRSKDYTSARALEYSSKINTVFNSKGLKLNNEQLNDKDDYSWNKWTLEFKNQYAERHYKRFRTDKIIKFIRLMLILIFGAVLVWSLIDLLEGDQKVGIMGVRIIVMIILLGVVIFAFSSHFIRHYEKVVMLIIISAMIIKTIVEIVQNNDGAMSTAFVPLLTFVIFYVSTYKLIFLNVIYIVIYLIRVVVYYSDKISKVSIVIIGLNYITLAFGIGIISGFVGYSIEKNIRIEYILKKKLEFEFQKGQNVLGDLLPRFVRDRVKQGIRYICEDQSSVTILFCEICDFDNICSTHTPSEIIDLLDKFFGICDRLCQKHAVTKIETVNKTYMACGGLNDAEENLEKSLLSKNHAVRVVELAQHILKKMEPVYLKTGAKFHIKIGINTGHIIAGVVGDQKPQFTLIGETTKIASGMCTSIEVPGMLRISSSTYDLVHDESWDFIPDQVEIKGKGFLNSYFVKDLKIRPSRQRKMTTFNDFPDAKFSQQQPLPSDSELNTSKAPLIDAEFSLTKTMTKSVSSFEIDKLDKAVFGDEDEKVLLAGPVQWLTCNLQELPPQYEYRIKTIERDIFTLLCGLWMTIIIYAVLTAIFIIGNQVSDDQYGTYFLLGIRLSCLCMMIILAVVLTRIYTNYLYPWIFMLIFLCASMSSISLISFVSETFIYVVVLELMYLNLVINYIGGLPFGHILIASISNVISWTAIIFKGYNTPTYIETIFFVFVFILINAVVSLMKEHYDRKTYNLNKLAQREIENTDKLLYQMMPPTAIKNLEDGITATDKFSNVTILFADISGFTQWSSIRKPIEAVNLLSKLFSSFDSLCAKHDVYKIHTIGDSYVVISFTEIEPETQRKPEVECENTINMALDMIKSVKRINRDKGVNFSLRIGIHTGDIIAGITGTNMIKYDIYGPDVDIAFATEINGFQGKINVSEESKKLLENVQTDRFDFYFNKLLTHTPTNRAVNTFYARPLKLEDYEF